MVFGTYVADYWVDGKWVDFTSVDLSLKDLNKMLNAVLLIEEEDSLIWKLNPNGLFSFSSLYLQNFEDCHEPCWAKAWFKSMTPKIKIFFWIFL